MWNDACSAGWPFCTAKGGIGGGDWKGEWSDSSLIQGVFEY